MACNNSNNAVLDEVVIFSAFNESNRGGSGGGASSGGEQGSVEDSHDEFGEGVSERPLTALPGCLHHGTEECDCSNSIDSAKVTLLSYFNSRSKAELFHYLQCNLKRRALPEKVSAATINSTCGWATARSCCS